MLFINSNKDFNCNFEFIFNFFKYNFLALKFSDKLSKIGEIEYNSSVIYNSFKSKLINKYSFGNLQCFIINDSGLYSWTKLLKYSSSIMSLIFQKSKTKIFFLSFSPFIFSFNSSKIDSSNSRTII